MFTKDECCRWRGSQNIYKPDDVHAQIVMHCSQPIAVRMRAEAKTSGEFSNRQEGGGGSFTEGSSIKKVKRIIIHNVVVR